MAFLQSFESLNCAIETNNIVAVTECIDEILQSPDLTNILFYTHYTNSLLFAIKNGNPEIFQTMCSVKKKLNFNLPQSALIVKQLHTYDDVRLRKIFLSYLDQCDTGTQAILVLTVYMHPYHNLIDDICDHEMHGNVRRSLAHTAVGFNHLDLLWRIAQTTPHIMPNLSECDLSTHQGRTWSEIHKRYSVWRAQQEHDALTAEVVGLEKSTAGRKM